jgi:hypothetical protein
VLKAGVAAILIPVHNIPAQQSAVYSCGDVAAAPGVAALEVVRRACVVMRCSDDLVSVVVQRERVLKYQQQVALDVPVADLRHSRAVLCLPDLADQQYSNSVIGRQHKVRY